MLLSPDSAVLCALKSYLSLQPENRRKSQAVSVVKCPSFQAIFSSVTHLDRNARAKFRDFADSRMWSGRVEADFRVQLQENPNASLAGVLMLVENSYIFTVKWSLYV